MTDDNFYTLEESAAILGMSRGDVEKMIHDGELQAEQEGGHSIIPVYALYERLFPYHRRNDFFGDPPKTSETLERLAELQETIDTLHNDLRKTSVQAEIAQRRERNAQEERDRLLKELQEEREQRHQLQQQLDRSDTTWWRRVRKTSR